MKNNFMLISPIETISNPRRALSTTSHRNLTLNFINSFCCSSFLSLFMKMEKFNYKAVWNCFHCVCVLWGCKEDLENETGEKILLELKYWDSKLPIWIWYVTAWRGFARFHDDLSISRQCTREEEFLIQFLISFHTTSLSSSATSSYVTRRCM